MTAKNTSPALLHEIPSAGFSVTLEARIVNKPGKFLQIVQAVADEGGSIAEVVLLTSDFSYNVRQITINCRSEAHSQSIIQVVSELDAVEVRSIVDDTLALHMGGKLEVQPRVRLRTKDALARAYTPGVARVCTRIHEDPSVAAQYTMKGNTVAVVTDGSAVLGLGNIGPMAALPVMEGKSVLFKQFAGVDAVPICLDLEDPGAIIDAVRALSPGFGGINLEDISAPRCFEIENALREQLDIPVFHDDQHGTAIVVLAGLLNALKLVNKELSSLKVVVNGFGAGGVACTRMLLGAGVKNLIPCDRAGTVYQGRTERMNPVKEELSLKTNPEGVKGSLADALKGADVFIGVSQPGCVTREMIENMAKDPIVFALANPVPEILPDEIRDVAAVIATGRSDYANQVNNVLAFPGIFRGALACRARDITDNMKLAAARAISTVIPEEEISKENIIPSVFVDDIGEIVAQKVIEAARKDGVAQ